MNIQEIFSAQESLLHSMQDVSEHCRTYYVLLLPNYLKRTRPVIDKLYAMQSDTAHVNS